MVTLNKFLLKPYSFCKAFFLLLLGRLQVKLKRKRKHYFAVVQLRQAEIAASKVTQFSIQELVHIYQGNLLPAIIQNTFNIKQPYTVSFHSLITFDTGEMLRVKDAFKFHEAVNIYQVLFGHSSIIVDDKPWTGAIDYLQMQVQALFPDRQLTMCADQTSIRIGVMV